MKVNFRADFFWDLNIGGKVDVQSQIEKISLFSNKSLEILISHLKITLTYVYILYIYVIYVFTYIHIRMYIYIHILLFTYPPRELPAWSICIVGTKGPGPFKNINPLGPLSTIHKGSAA